MIIAGCASINGNCVLKSIVEKSGKKSLIVFVVGTVLLCSFFSMPTVTYLHLHKQYVKGMDIWGLKDFCNGTVD